MDCCIKVLHAATRTNKNKVVSSVDSVLVFGILSDPDSPDES